MSVEFNGSDQYCSESSSLLTNEVIVMVAYARSTDVTAAQTVLALGNNGASGRFEMAFLGSAAGDPIRGIKENDAGSSAQANSTSGYSANTWHSAIVAFLGNSSRAAYIDGGDEGTNTTSITDPTPDYITVGARRVNAVSNYFSGDVAEVCILDVSLTAAQIEAHGQGFSIVHMVPLANIRGWYPMFREYRNRVGNGYPNLTPTGGGSGPPSFTAHPPQYIPPRINARMSF
jgi:hypothetical protein